MAAKYCSMVQAAVLGTIIILSSIAEVEARGLPTVEEVCKTLCQDNAHGLAIKFLRNCVNGASRSCCRFLRDSRAPELEECSCSMHLACELDPFFGGVAIFKKCGIDLSC